MDLGNLVASLPTKRAAIYTLEHGKATRHSFADLASDVANTASRLRDWGVRAGARVGIFAPNSYHWLVHDLALIDIGAISIPFTDDFAGKIDRALIDQHQIALLLLSKNSRLPPPPEPHIAFMDAQNGDVRAIDRPVSADDEGVLTLAFSSGSAGGLKGLVIDRRGVEATVPPICEAIGVTSRDRLLLFLPLANFQQRNMCYSAILYDFDIIITSYIELMGAIQILQPTTLIAPPLYYQMIHTRFANMPEAKRRRWEALGKALSLIPLASLRRSLAQKLFAEFYRQFGGRMRLPITGMALIKREVAEFFALMQLPLAESYGLVETGSITYRPPASRNYASVGKLLRGIRLEFGPDGEVFVLRDTSLTRRYFQCAEGENERTFTAPGRIATGDIGRMDADGYLYLMGRKKELIVTAGGYKIHPEIVEAELAGCPDIAQAAVFLKPGAAALACVAALNDPDSAGARQRVQAFARGLKSIGPLQIGEIIFTEEPFSVENGMLRPNLKMDRRRIGARYNLD